MAESKLPHTGLSVGEVSPHVLVCGDPGRATAIAAYLDNPQKLAEFREYRTFKGQYQGVDVTVTSHGIGAPGAAIAFEELIAAGGRHFIRVGTCGGMRADVNSGQLVIANAAVQSTGYGRETVPPGYPAVADPRLSLALEESAAELGHAFNSGIVLTRDNFYAGVNTPLTPDYHTLSAANVLAVEMECAALFIIGSLRQVTTAAILAVDGNVLRRGESMESFSPHRGVVKQAVDVAIRVALRALTKIE